MHNFKSFLSVLLSILILQPAICKAQDSDGQEDAIIVLNHNWGTETEIGKLLPIGNNTYTGTIDTQYFIILKYNGTTYRVKEWTESFKTGTIYEFSPNYYQNISFGNELTKRTLRAVISDDKSTILLEVPDPISLSVNVGGTATTLAENLSNESGTYTYPSAIEVEDTPVAIGNIMLGKENYGFGTFPDFTTSDEAQSREIEIVKGGAGTTLSIRGTYSLSVTLENGIPVKARIVKSKVVPPLTVNSVKFVYDDGSYSGSLTLAKNTPLTLTYNGVEKYYPTSHLDGSDGATRTVRLSTTDNGYGVQHKGTYRFSVNFDTKILTYTNTTPLDRTAYSPTLSETFITYERGDRFIPDEINSLWYQANSTDMGYSVSCTDQNSYDFHYGNGHLGVTVRGSAFEDIMLNEKTHFEGSRPTDFSASSSRFEYKRAGYLRHNLSLNNFKDYELITQQDLIKGVGTSMLDISSYSGDNSKIFKEYFVSHPDDVFVMHITSADATFGIDLNFTELNAKSSNIEGCSGYFTASSALSTVSTTFACKVIADESATLTSANGGIKVAGANDILLIVSSVSDYDITKDSYVDASRDCESEALSIVEKAAQKTWQQLYDTHISDHQSLMEACTFDIADDNSLSTRELLAACKTGTATIGQQRMLDQLLFQLGRYKTVGSSRSGDQLPSNLRGIWMSAQRWLGDIHADLNVEMNYWLAENTNLASCHEPFLDYIINMSKKAEWKNYAQYRAPGCDAEAWTLDNANSIFGEAALYISEYSEANAWFCYHLWQHYQYSLDRDYLRRITPVMMNACKFWMANMTWDSSIQKWICPNVWSPENQSGGNSAVHARQMVWELFRNTIEGIRILGADFSDGQNYLPELENKFKDIDPGLHVVNGALCEWHGTTPAEDGHRHLSHLMCLYPMAQVSPYDEDPTYFNAAVKALDLRGDGDGGEACNWQKAWKMACRARALDQGDYGESWGAYHQLELGYQYLFDNLNAATAGVHQIDGNSGITAGIAECLMQSYSGIIDILPVLPSAWATGSVRGLKAVGNFEVEITWKDGLLVEAKVTDCINNTMREGVKVRIHDYNIPDIEMLRVNGLKASERSRTAGYYKDSSNGTTYVVELPAGTTGATVLNFTSSPTSGIDDIESPNPEEDDSGKPVEYFDLQGHRINNPAPGIYIRRQGSKAEKVLIK